LQGSVEQFLEEVARRGSWVGGGSVAALSAALAAALLEKLLTHPQAARRLRRIRHACVRLIERDAVTFARVIKATRLKNHQGFRRALKAAIDVPCQVVEHAQAIRRTARDAARSVKPQFQSDLRCAIALADAAGTSARILIDTNLAWLKDPDYTKAIRHRLKSSVRAYAHSHLP